MVRRNAVRSSDRWAAMVANGKEDEERGNQGGLELGEGRGRPMNRWVSFKAIDERACR